MPLADAILDGIGFTIGGKVVEHLHKKMSKNKRKNSGTATSGFIGVRVNGSKVQLKLPNKNPETLAAAKKVASKLGYKINPAKERSLQALYQFGDTYGKHASVGYDGDGKYWVTLTDWKTRKGGGYNDLPLKVALSKARKFVKK